MALYGFIIKLGAKQHNTARCVYIHGRFYWITKATSAEENVARTYIATI